MRCMILACSMGLVAFAGSAKSAEVIYSGEPTDRVVVERYGMADDDYAGDELSYNDESGTVVVRGDRRRAVVIQDRPLNCGTYKYWDGETCADARDRN